MGGQLESKVAVITGAGRGIGRGLAIGFAAEGARVVCAARTKAQLDETLRLIHAAGGQGIAVACDVGSASDVQALYERARAEYGAGNAGSAYSASKAGVWMLIRVLAEELRDYGICVNELIPGLVDTDILTAEERPADPALSLEWFKQPSDVVPLALFLATQPPTGPTSQSFSLMRRDAQ